MNSSARIVDSLTLVAGLDTEPTGKVDRNVQETVVLLLFRVDLFSHVYRWIVDPLLGKTRAGMYRRLLYGRVG